VMDEATRCDRLLLMRDGALLADDTLDGLLRTTNTADVEQAFLALVGHDAASQSGTPSAPPSEEER
jgi:ABC-2 type transport system ATP-binding protein